LGFLPLKACQLRLTRAEDLIAGFEFERAIAKHSNDAMDFWEKIAEKELRVVKPDRKNLK
jgi:hypothetical protein